jgi:hypothetical protein
LGDLQLPSVNKANYGEEHDKTYFNYLMGGHFEQYNRQKDHEDEDQFQENKYFVPHACVKFLMSI